MTVSTDTQQQTQFRVLLIGDDCTDEYLYGVVDRISPEAPVPVLKITNRESRPGMAGNVQKNLEALGCKVFSYLGPKSTKTRIIDERSKQQIVRLDNDFQSQPLAFTTVNITNVDAVVISDYNKGWISYELVEKIIANFKGPVFIDTKKTDLERFQGAWVKVNELEHSRVTSECTGLIVTRGSKGAEAIHHEIVCPAVKVEVADVTGAGDTFLAAFAYQYLDTGDLKQSIQFAVQASAVTVQHLGVYAPTLKEMG